MAPKGMKRPAAATATGASKKSVDVVGGKVKLVKEGLQLADFLPDTTRSMLVDTCGFALSDYQEQRHKFQADIVAMVEESLIGVQKALQEKIKDLETQVANSDAEKQKRANQEEEAKRSLEALTAEVAKTVEPKAQAKEALHQKKKDLHDATKAKEAGDKALLDTAALKERLETTMKDVYKPMKESVAGGNDGKKMLATLLKYCKDRNYDLALRDALPSTLKKVPEKRGTFDALVLKQCEDAFDSDMAEFTKKLESGEPDKQARAAAVTAAEEAHKAAEQQDQAASEAHSKAVADEGAGKKHLKECSKAVADFLPEMQQISNKMDSSKAQLQGFESGPLIAFRELKELKPPPPPVEETTAAPDASADATMAAPAEPSNPAATTAA